ncbi:MAG: carbon-nitrogen hydrolase family protein [Nitrospiraceae bacterium]|nr:MAG: carbon-nitrogen hydrolase family protein [Nitrospiraceae bacterium]
MKIRICIAQINYRGNVERHIEGLKKIIGQNREADLIVFPELILHGHPSLERPEGLLYRKVRQYYLKIKDQSDDLFQYIRAVNTRVIIGELKGKPGQFYNAATYVDNKTIESYFKTHVHWTEKFIPGNKINVFKSPLGNIGINICFDAAFPEVWRVAALQGAQLIVNISAAPQTFPVEYMWMRMKSAALNNQVFVIYANRPGDYFSGHSAVFNPRGETVISAKTKDRILKTEIDLDEVSNWRKEERIFRNRRTRLYREITRQRKGK